MNQINFEEVFNTPFFSIEATTGKYSNSNPYYRINTKDSVICCLLDEGDNILLVEQFRPNLGYITLEFPAGGLDVNETPQDAAIREIKEEVGVDCSYIYLGSYRLMMNRTINKEHLFIGLTVGDVVSQAEPGIKTRKIQRKELIKVIYANELEQLAALGIIQLINLKFNINFLSDEKVINKIWK
jgi:8-oxo-dGTP pyrophosphatase MutT (NUDIX family)